MKQCLESIPKERRLSFMEVCGTHTMAIARMGIRSLLGNKIRLISGPGCPVCVTSESDIARALYLAGLNNVIITTFGDMLRVPSNGVSLQDINSEGGRTEVVFSPVDALEIAKQNEDSQIVFLGVGFETTSPTIAASAILAREQNIHNFSILPMMKTVTPALKFLCEQPDIAIDGFILPGHVSAIIGEEPYIFISDDYNLPCVIAGFEPEDVADTILRLTKMAISGSANLENSYSRAVKAEGNPKAKAIVNKVFRTADAEWRGIGSLPDSGLAFKDKFSEFNASNRFTIPHFDIKPDPRCRCGEVILGKIIPPECPQFGLKCTPTKPLGPCMVSSEGACAAYFKYRMI
ncbi:hydrogenase formation protein HypD [bacterium]|nr:hydrogenase formation protein HypD [bacterium]